MQQLDKIQTSPMTTTTAKPQTDITKKKKRWGRYCVRARCRKLAVTNKDECKFHCRTRRGCAEDGCRRRALVNNDRCDEHRRDDPHHAPNDTAGNHDQQSCYTAEMEQQREGEEERIATTLYPPVCIHLPRHGWFILFFKYFHI